MLNDYGPNLSPDDAYSYVLQHVDVHGEQAERRALEQLWFEDAAYYLGQHHFVPEGGLLRPPRSHVPGRVYYKANRVLPKVLQAVAKLEELEITTEVLPESSHFLDRHAARIGDLVLDHLRHATKHEDKVSRAMLVAAIYGTGFWKVHWNPRSGERHRVYWRSAEDRYPDPLVKFDPEIRRLWEQNEWFDDTYAGEVEIDVATPFSIYPDETAKGGGIRDCRWVAQIHTRSVFELRSEYPDRADEIAPDQSWKGAEMWRETLKNLTSHIHGVEFSPQRTGRADEVTRIIEFWEAARPENGMQGRKILIAGRAVLENTPNPYTKFGIDLPFIKFDWFPNEDRFWGSGLVEQILDPQKAYNESRRYALEQQKFHGHGRAFFPKGSGVTPVQIVAMGGQTYEFNSPVGPPIFQSPPNLPPYIMENSAIAAKEMDEIAAQAIPAKGAMPSGIRSAPAIMAVQKENNALLTPTAKSVRAGVESAGEMMLRLVNGLWDTPRIVRAVGRGRSLEIGSFRGADLRGHTRVRVIGRSGLMQTREERLTRVMEFAQMGQLDPNDPKYGDENRMLLLSALDTGTADEMIEAKLQQKNKEEREIERMIIDESYLAPIHPWFDVHVRAPVLERFMNTDEFDSLPEHTASKFVGRYQEFTQILQAEMQAQLAMMQQAAGAPGAKGEASQPRGQTA